MTFSKKMTQFFENKSNIIKIIIVLITLFIIYRIFTTDINENHNNIINNKNNNNKNNNTIIENFEAMTIPYYGNVIPLNNNTNTPINDTNQYTFNLNKSSRIDTLVFKFKSGNEIDNINIKYKYGNNDYRFLKGNGSVGSPPSFSLDVIDNRVIITGIENENNTLVYTSQLILIINSANTTSSKNKLDSYGIFGGDRKLLTETKYKDKTKTENIENIEIAEPKEISNTDNNNITKYTYTINNVNDNKKIYCMKLNYTTPGNMDKNIINIKIEYENTLYPLDKFEVQKTYKLRYDDYCLNKNDSNKYTYIILDEPIIASKLIISTNIENNALELNAITINSSNPNSDDITEFKATVNLVINKNNSLETNICPSINELVDKQNKTQEICDNLEYQDKIKSEKIRLERNKQYLLKLKNQQEQISDLNKVIHELEDKREARATTADQIRVLQYQKQKGDASTIRDLANQRIESQDNNKLFMDLNLNYTN